MRSVRWVRALLLLLAVAPAAPAWAEWHIVPLVGLTFDTNTNANLVTNAGEGTVGTHPNFGGSVALLGAGILGVETIGVFTPNFKADTDLVSANVQSSRALAIMGNVVLTTPRRWTEYSLRPYVSGGLGLMRLSIVDTGGVLGSTTNTTGFDIGGGAIGFFSQHTGVRFDLRYYKRLGADPEVLPTGDPQLSFWTASVGVVIRR